MYTFYKKKGCTYDTKSFLVVRCRFIAILHKIVYDMQET